MGRTDDDRRVVMSAGGLASCALRLSFGEEVSEMTYVSFYTGLVHDFVDVIGRDADFDLTRSYIEHFSREPAHLAHPGLFFLCEDLGLVPADYTLLFHQHQSANALVGH